MPRTVTMNEAEQDLGNVLQWAKENREGVILEQLGKPEGVLMAYDEYAELTRLRRQEVKRNTLAVLEKIRSEGAELNQNLTDEEKYRLAGFSEEAIQEIIDQDKEQARRE